VPAWYHPRQSQYSGARLRYLMDASSARTMHVISATSCKRPSLRRRGEAVGRRWAGPKTNSSFCHDGGQLTCLMPNEKDRR